MGIQKSHKKKQIPAGSGSNISSLVSLRFQKFKRNRRLELLHHENITATRSHSHHCQLCISPHHYKPHSPPSHSQLLIPIHRSSVADCIVHFVHPCTKVQYTSVGTVKVNTGKLALASKALTPLKMAQKLLPEFFTKEGLSQCTFAPPKAGAKVKRPQVTTGSSYLLVSNELQLVD